MTRGRDELRRLTKQLDDARLTLVGILIARLDWREVNRYVQGRSGIMSSLPYQIRARNYTMAQAMAIRAFADRDRGTHAIGFLIDSFVCNANSISRQDVMDHLWSLSSVGLQDDFEPAVKFQEGTDRIDPEPINRDKEELENKVKQVKIFADKWVAHLDKDREDYPPPDISEFDGPINYLDQLYCKYVLWLTASNMESAEPKILLPWAAAYSVPWIPPNEWPVEVLSKFE